MNKFVIICGGECDVNGVPRELLRDAYVIAADSGYNTAKALGVTPDLLVGDMDSVGEVPADVPLHKVKAEKDFTDTMLAVDIAKSKGADDIVIIGGGGGRADHFLSNVFLLESLENEGIKASLHDGANSVAVVSDRAVTLRQNGGYFGLLALEDSVVSVSGCKYPLERAQLKRTLPYAVSNEISGESALISVEGRVVIVQSKK